METQLTAVEWLEYQLSEGTMPIKEAFNQAKAMEKEQIIKCWDNGFANGYDLGKHDDQANPDDAEQYYKETFKSE